MERFDFHFPHVRARCFSAVDVGPRAIRALGAPAAVSGSRWKAKEAELGSYIGIRIAFQLASRDSWREKWQVGEGPARLWVYMLRAPLGTDTLPKESIGSF